MSQRQPGADWRAEASGALNATAAMLPLVLSYGLIVYGGLGEAAGRIGLQASVAALVVAGTAVALWGAFVPADALVRTCHAWRCVRLLCRCPMHWHRCWTPAPRKRCGRTHGTTR